MDVRAEKRSRKAKAAMYKLYRKWNTKLLQDILLKRLDADKYRDDFHVRKKRVAEAKEKRMGRVADGEGKSELRGLRDVQKDKVEKARRREKTGRHSGGNAGRGRGGMTADRGRGGGRGGRGGGRRQLRRGGSRETDLSTARYRGGEDGSE